MYEEWEHARRSWLSENYFTLQPSFLPGLGQERSAWKAKKPDNFTKIIQRAPTPNISVWINLHGQSRTDSLLIKYGFGNTFRQKQKEIFILRVYNPKYSLKSYHYSHYKYRQPVNLTITSTLHQFIFHLRKRPTFLHYSGGLYII